MTHSKERRSSLRKVEQEIEAHQISVRVLNMEEALRADLTFFMSEIKKVPMAAVLNSKTQHPEIHINTHADKWEYKDVILAHQLGSILNGGVAEGDNYAEKLVGIDRANQAFREMEELTGVTKAMRY